MAATLSGLPAELLLQICDHGGPGWIGQYFSKTLRAVCRVINAKIIHYYGQKWYKDFDVM